MNNLILCFVFSLLSNIPCLCGESKFQNNIVRSKRNLSYYSSGKYSLYYERPFEDNSITGSGYFLKDKVYNSQCELLKCQFCCFGPLNKQKCGEQLQCKQFNDYVNTYRIVIACVSSFSFVFFIFLAICCGGYNKRNCGESIKLGFYAIGTIIFLPFVLLWLLIKHLTNKKNKPDTKSENVNVKTNTNAEPVGNVNIINDNNQPNEDRELIIRANNSAIPSLEIITQINKPSLENVKTSNLVDNQSKLESIRQNNLPGMKGVSELNEFN